jgi:hypothetical protein
VVVKRASAALAVPRGTLHLVTFFGAVPPMSAGSQTAVRVDVPLN